MPTMTTPLAITADLVPKQKTKTLEDLLKEQASYEYPKGELTRSINTLGQQLTAQEQQQLLSFQQMYAGRTGGRMSGVRGMSDIGGQAALARAAGNAQLMQQAYQQQLTVRQNALNAYIQKYGMDKQAEVAMEQIRAQQQQAEMGAWADLFGSLALIPFLV